MKQLLLHVLTCCAVLLPIQQASAKKTFGDFAPKTKFKMVVTKVTATVNDGSGNKPTKVPSTMPQFKVKDKIEFTIGGQGQLNGKLKQESFSIPYVGTAPGTNTYIYLQPGLVTVNYTGILGKTFKKKPSSLELALNRTELNVDFSDFPGIGGSTSKTYSVVYEMKITK